MLHKWNEQMDFVIPNMTLFYLDKFKLKRVFAQTSKLIQGCFLFRCFQYNHTSAKLLLPILIITILFMIMLPIIRFKQTFKVTTGIEIPLSDVRSDKISISTIGKSCLSPKVTNDSMKFQLPVLNVGFPKMGSSTLTAFFNCGNLKSSHYYCNSGKGGAPTTCGTCMHQAVAMGKPPLESCGAFDFYGELNYVSEPPCHWPQIDNLEEIHAEAPNATFILSFRDIKSWTRSIRRWKEFNVPYLIDALRDYCNVGSTDAELEQFFCDQVNRVRTFVQVHPSHKLVEVQLEDTENTSNILFRQFGIKRECWGHKNKNNKNNNRNFETLQLNDKRRRSMTKNANKRINTKYNGKDHIKRKRNKRTKTKDKNIF